MAAIFGNVVQIYSTTTFENVSNLKGHNGKVKSAVWSLDDTRVVTCGIDGAVYEWEVLTGRRLAENVLKLCSYTGVALSLDAKTTFAVGSDHTLKEISDSQVHRFRFCNCSKIELDKVKPTSPLWHSRTAVSFWIMQKRGLLVPTPNIFVFVSLDL